MQIFVQGSRRERTGFDRRETDKKAKQRVREFDAITIA
jgi:hypothetical protein